MFIRLSNSLYCPYFLMDGSTFENIQSLNFLARSNFDAKTSSLNPVSFRDKKLMPGQTRRADGVAFSVAF